MGTLDKNGRVTTCSKIETNIYLVVSVGKRSTAKRVWLQLPHLNIFFPLSKYNGSLEEALQAARLKKDEVIKQRSILSDHDQKILDLKNQLKDLKLQIIQEWIRLWPKDVKPAPPYLIKQYTTYFLNNETNERIELLEYVLDWRKRKAESNIQRYRENPEPFKKSMFKYQRAHPEIFKAGTDRWLASIGLSSLKEYYHWKKSNMTDEELKEFNRRRGLYTATWIKNNPEKHKTHVARGAQNAKEKKLFLRAMRAAMVLETQTKG